MKCKNQKEIFIQNGSDKWQYKLWRTAKTVHTNDRVSNFGNVHSEVEKRNFN